MNTLEELEKAHEALQEENAELETKIETYKVICKADTLVQRQLKEHIAELQAHCNYLKEGINKIYLMDGEELIYESGELCEELSIKTPRQSLAAIKAEAIEDAIEATCNSWDVGLLNSTYIEDAFFQYAQNIREGE